MAQLDFSSQLGTGGTGTGGASSVTFSVTVPANSGALLVCIGAGSGSGDSTSSVVLRNTGGGATQTTFTSAQTSTVDNRSEIWYARAEDLPAAGTYEIHIAFSAGVRAGAVCIELDGELDASNPVRASNANGSGAVSSVTVEPDDMYIVVAKAFNDPGSPDAGLTSRFDAFTVGTGGTTSVWQGIATKAITSSGTESGDWGTGVDTWQVNASFTPESTGGNPNSVKVTYWDPTDPSRPGA